MTLKQIPDKQTTLGLLRKYDPVPSFNLAERLVEGVTKEEAESWFNHPCTQSLIASLDGDLCRITSSWMAGHYSSENSVDATAQGSAKAQGEAEAIDLMLERIRDYRNLKIQEEIDES